MNTKFIIGIVIGSIVLIGGIVFISVKTNSSRPDHTVLAQCLKDKGAVFYGAFWCSHCQATKKLFGAGAKALPYVECSTPDGNSQKPLCTEKKIESYPTWEFADGSRLTGEVSLETLSEKTNCPLPAVTTQ